MSFICDTCGHTFDEPDRHENREYLDYGIGSRWATVSEYQCCPYCGGEDHRELTADELEDMT